VFARPVHPEMDGTGAGAGPGRVLAWRDDAEPDIL
jgi:hypothetical protein